MTLKTSLIYGCAAIVLLTTGCERAKEEMGLTRHTPDEFAVMKRAPLEIPADMTDLPKPRPGAQRPQEVSAKNQAQQVVLGSSAAQSGEQSGAEQSLLSKAGAGSASPKIRTVVDRESAENVEDHRPVIKRLLNIGSGEQPSTVVDPAAEAQRIQSNKSSGKPVTSGETPTQDE